MRRIDRMQELDPYGIKALTGESDAHMYRILHVRISLRSFGKFSWEPERGPTAGCQCHFWPSVAAAPICEMPLPSEPQERGPQFVAVLDEVRALERQDCPRCRSLTVHRPSRRAVDLALGTTVEEPRERVRHVDAGEALLRRILKHCIPMAGRMAGDDDAVKQSGIFQGQRGRGNPWREARVRAGATQT